MKTEKTLLTTSHLQKLSEWTLSANVTETMGLSSDDDARIKKELIDLCDKGLVEKDGVRRGLKFRYIGKTKSKVKNKTADTQEQEQVAHDSGDMLAYLKQKEHDKKNLKLAGSSLSDLLKYVVLTCAPSSDPSILSYSVAIKHTTTGVLVRVYNGIILEHERLFTKDKFLKYIAESGVQFSADSTKSEEPATVV